MELMQASRQWSSRPQDERFLSLHELHSKAVASRQQSKAAVLANRHITVEPAADDEMNGIVVRGPQGNTVTPTHWSFGQLASLAGAPAGYMRELPAPMAADCLNYGLHQKRDVEEVGVLLTRNEQDIDLRAATGPRYGRIWNADVVGNLMQYVGDGVTGQWRVPGEFGKPVEVNRGNTTIYGSDRDMFVFLADEQNLVEVPGAGRNGETELLSRGFFVWNSEVGAATFGTATFLFRYVCMNRIVWGAQDVNEIKIRHTSGAPERFLEEAAPALDEYSRGSVKAITDGVLAARERRIDNVEEFLGRRFSLRMAKRANEQHLVEEGRPVETLWDATQAITAIARDIPNQNDRVDLERKAGDLMKLAA